MFTHFEGLVGKEQNKNDKSLVVSHLCNGGLTFTMTGHFIHNESDISDIYWN